MAPLLVKFTGGAGSSGSAILAKLPDICPRCHHGIEPSVVVSRFNEVCLYVVFECPRDSCRRLFFGTYLSGIGGTNREWTLLGVDPTDPIPVLFSDEIRAVSPNFSEIYSQAKAAEDAGLKEICGCGYRRALEFLVKDFAIRERPADEEAVARNTSLGNVIKTYIDDPRIKEAAEMATWLGNDNTHYRKRHEGMSLDDLKDLIALSVNWVENYERHAAYKRRFEKPKSV